MSTSYLAGAALERLAQAQADIDSHVYVVNGLCAACRQPAPCRVRDAASSVFATYHQLPLRRPGLALRGVEMRIEHQVRRPDWVCVTDGADWPCVDARKLLAGAYRNTPDALVRYLAHVMAQAAAELGVANPSALYRRFIAWTLPRGEACRVCGKSGHTVVAGLPPRLFPCDSRLPNAAVTRAEQGLAD